MSPTSLPARSTPPTVDPRPAGAEGRSSISWASTTGTSRRMIASTTPASPCCRSATGKSAQHDAHQMTVRDDGEVLLHAAQQQAPRFGSVVRRVRPNGRSVIIARPTGMPDKAAFIWTRLASWVAPIHTNSAMKRRRGFPVSPAQEPEEEGDELTEVRGDLRRPRVFDACRQERPENASAVHREGRYEVEAGQRQIDEHQTLEKRPVNHVDLFDGRTPPVADIHTNRTAAMTTLTAGPARATHSSCFGSSGMRSIRATPPMGSRVMSRADTETTSRQRVAKLVQHHPAKQRQDERHAPDDGAGHSAREYVLPAKNTRRSRT